MAAIGSREWMLEQNPNIFDASKGAPGTQFRTPTGQSIETTIGSAYRPRIVTDQGTYGFVADQVPDSFSSVLVGDGKYNWKPDYVGPGGGSPTGQPTGGSPSGSRGGGGGGGYSAPKIDTAGILAAMNRYRPQMFEPKDLKLEQYKPPEYYGFDETTYDMMKSQIAQSIGNARTQGMNAYGEARTQMDNIPVAFQGGMTTTNPGMSGAMERMFAANGTPTALNEQTMREGVQADAAFGNVMALMGEASRQRRTSDQTALAGDERRLNEELSQQETMLKFQTDMARQRNYEQYEKEKWQFGENVARTNWEVRNAEISANTQAANDAQKSNLDTANAANQAANQTIIDLLASGVAVDPNAYQQVTV